jgi:hypothetical protein
VPLPVLVLVKLTVSPVLQRVEADVLNEAATALVMVTWLLLLMVLKQPKLLVTFKVMGGLWGRV